VQDRKLDQVERACVRAANVTIRDMKRRVDSVAAIARVAPYLGLLAMFTETRDYLKSLPGCGYGDCAGGPAEVFVLPAAGLLVASIAMVAHGILSDRIESFRIEMKCAALQLMNDLVQPSNDRIDVRG
jgi:biopolymer transport protein ExbB/TolQ